MAAAAAAVALMTGAAGCSGEDADGAQVGQDAEDTASGMIADMTSYAYDSLDEDFTWISEYLTADLAASYQDDAEGIKNFVREAELQVTSEVRDLAHEVVAEDDVIVYATVKQTFVTPASDETVAEEWVLVRVRMVPEGDGWIITRLNVGATSDPEAGFDSPTRPSPGEGGSGGASSEAPPADSGESPDTGE